MSEDQHFDTKIRDHFQKNNIVQIPDDIRKRIDQTLRDLPKNPTRKQGKKYIYVASVAVLVFGGLLGSGFVSPTMADTLEKIPVLRSVFDYVGDLGLKRAYQEGFTKNSTQSITDQGITFSITDILYDGNRFSIGYQIVSNDPQKDIRNLYPQQVMINGESMDYKMYDLRKTVNSANETGVLYLEANSYPDNFTLHLELHKIGNVIGNWKLAIPVIKNNSNTKTFSPMISKQFQGTAFTVNSIRLTPSGIEMDIKNFSTNFDQKSSQIGFQVQDDKGRVLQNIMSSKVGEVEKYVFAPYDQMPKYLVVKPFLYKFSQQGSGEDNTVTTSLTNPLPITLQQGEVGQITVTKIEYLFDKTIVHYQVQGTDPFSQANALAIENSTGDKYIDNNPLPIPQVENGIYSFVKELPPINKNQSLFLLTQKMQSQNWIPDLEVKVNLQ